jgi:hypothetical protein
MIPPDATAATLWRPTIRLPCAESCAHFRQINPDRWEEYGRCAHPRSPRRGYPVLIGRDCRYFESHPDSGITRAS